MPPETQQPQSAPPPVQSDLAAPPASIKGAKVTNIDKNEAQLPSPPPPPEETVAPGQGVQSVKFSIAPTKVLRLYLVPIVSLIVFFGILLGLVIPGINTIFSTLDMVAQTNEQSTAADETLRQLQALAGNQFELESDLQLIREMAPAEATQVAGFQQKIVEIARSQGLEVTGTALEEIILASEGADITANLGLIEIPSRFTIEGSLPQLMQFVAQAQSVDDFVIIGEMSLRTNQVVNLANLNSLSIENWTLTLILVKYQFQIPDEVNRLEDFYRNVPPTVRQESEVIEFARERQAQIMGATDRVEDPAELQE